MGNKRNYTLIQRAPLMIILGAWIPQALYRCFVSNIPFMELEFFVAALIFLAIASYLVGAFLGGKIDRKFLLLRLERPQASFGVGISPSGKYKIFRFLVALLAIIFAFTNVVYPLLSGGDIAAMRDVALDEWSEGGFVSKLSAFLVNSLACFVLLCISFDYRVNRKVNWYLSILFVFVCLAAFARTLLLIGLFILLIRFASDHKSPIKLFLKLIGGFIALFLFLSVFAKDNSANEGGALDIVLAHIEVYFFGGVAGLNTFVVNGDPTYNAILSIPRFVQNLLPLSTAMPPQYFDFVETPVPLNVFTAIFPPYHDFGVAGVVVLFFLYGMIAAAACRKYAATDSFIWQVFAGFMLYATAMSIFDDQFIRALPVFLIFIFSAMVFRALQRNFEIGKRR